MCLRKTTSECRSHRVSPAVETLRALDSRTGCGANSTSNQAPHVRDGRPGARPRTSVPKGLKSSLGPGSVTAGPARWRPARLRGWQEHTPLPSPSGFATICGLMEDSMFFYSVSSPILKPTRGVARPEARLPQLADILVGYIL